MKKALHIIVISVFLFSCAKEQSDVFVPYPGNSINDTVWVQQISAGASVNQILDAITFAAKDETVDATKGGLIKFSELVDVNLPERAFLLQNGTTVTGNVRVEMLHLRTKGDMVRFSKPTTSFNRLLESGGEFYIRAYKEGQELLLAPGKLIKFNVRSPSTIQGMKLFYGEFSSPSPLPAAPFTWVPANDNSSVRTFEVKDSFNNIIRGYEVLSQRLRWVSVANFIDSTQPKTRINAITPPNFTNANTTVYAVFKDQKTVVQLIPEVSSRTFFAINIPLNKNITLISISKINDEFYVGSKEVSVSAHMAVKLEPQKKTKAQLSQFLDALQ